MSTLQAKLRVTLLLFQGSINITIIGFNTVYLVIVIFIVIIFNNIDYYYSVHPYKQ